MANGYLGKISAIVSANTADFDGKLSKSAKEVSSFARSVQSNLTSASRQAARSLEGIYTPLQKFERSLQAAASMKLSFKGFPGMIKDLDSLQSRLNSALSKRQVDIVLKTTGMSSVSALRDAISGLKSKDIELIARVGGIDKLKALGGKITADVDIGASRKTLADLTVAAEAAKAKVASIGNVPVTVKVNAEGVDSLRAKLDEARGAAGKLMGGEFMGQKSLTKAISGVSGELIKVEAELARAAAAKKTLEAMSAGPRSKPEELNRANDRVSSLTGQQQELGKKLAELEKYRDLIKTVMREIKQAEAGGGAAGGGGGDIAAAKKEEAAAIRAVSRAAKELQTQITAKYGVDIDLSDLDQLISRGGKASDVLERLPALMDELGRSDLEAASNKMRQLVSVSEELSDPIKAAQATLTGLAKEVQAGFLPALVQSQSELESLNALIEEGIAPTAAIKKNFDQVKASVDATVASVRQLAEVSEKAGRLKTGRELVFAQPALSESLDRGAAVGNKAAGLPASAISSSPRLVESLVKVNQLTREAEAAFAKLQMKANVGLPTGSAQRSLDLLVLKMNEAHSVAEKEIKVHLDTADAKRKATELKARLDGLREEVRFTVTGGFSNAGQIEAEVSRVTADIQKLDDTQKAAFGQRAMLVIDLLGDNKIQDAAIEVKNLRSDLDQQMELKVTTDSAQKAVDDFKAKMDRVREQNAFVITDRPQNMEQAESRESSLRGEVGQLDGSRRAKFRGLLEDAAVARETGKLDKYNDALDKITIKLASEKKLVIDDKKAQDSLDAINRDLRSIADALGPPAGMDRLKESTQAADAAVEKLAAGLDKARLKTDIGQLRVDLGAAEMLPAGAAKDQAIADISTRAEGITQDAGRVAGDADSVEKARARITSLNDAWAQSVRGLPQTEAKADAFFTGILADIGKLDLADRISLDPIIGEIINLIQTGAGISTVTARMLELEAATNELASAGKVSTAIEKLSPTAARNDLEARLAAAKAAASSPIPLATPGESVEAVGRETELRGSLGKDLADSSRGLDLLKGGITSLKSQIDALPEGVRSRFIPAIRDAENEFVRLSTSSSALPGQIDAARQRVQQLAAEASRATQAMNFQQSFGGAGAAGLNLGLDQRSLQGYNAQLQILQGAIGRASAEARGPAVAAFERLRNAVATAFDEGNIDSGVQRERLAAIRTEAVAAAAAVSRIRVGSLTRDVARAGDIGRAGFDKFGLAMNQAGYAIDDFMSSTGGLEFKLRAISNNITQMAFILGGTTGLWIGLGAVIAGQAAVALIKWYNNGRTAEDQTKALNEALARQKGLVEELAEAFKSLGDAMSRGTLSEGGQQTKDFTDQVETIRKKGRESREGKVSDLDRDVQRERAQQNALKKQLESETDIGRRVVITRQIEQSKAAEREAMDRVRDRPEPTGADVAGLIERAAVRMEEAGRSQRPSDTEFPVANSIREAGAGLDVGDTPEAIRSQIRALSNATSSVSETSAQTFFGLPTEESATSNVAATAFADMTERLTAKLEAAIEDLAINVVEASRGPAEQIRQAQEEVAKAIELGLPGARVFQAELDKNATALQKSIKKLETTFSGKDESGKDLTVDEKEARTKQAQDEIDALQAQRARIAAQSDAFRYERTVDPQRQIDARMGRASSNLGAAGLDDGRIARRMREIENERETIRQRSALPEFQAPEMVRGLQDAEQALNEEAAAIEAATIAIKIFADALNRASEEAKGNLNSAQQRADETRRADLGNSTPQTQEARKQAEADLERQKETERAAQTEIAVERDRLEKMQKPDAERMQKIDEELKSGRGASDEARSQLAGERAAMEAEVSNQNAAAADEVERARKKDADGQAASNAKNEADRDLSRLVTDTDSAAEALGIKPAGRSLEAVRDDIRQAGRGDIADDLERRHDEAIRAIDNTIVAIRGFGGWDAIDKASEELAAALKHQAEVANAGAARLAEIDAEIAAVPAGDSREELIREREALKAKMEDDAKASQAKVDAARDASTREAEQAKSGERGRELTRTPEERFKAESEQGLADIQTYFERRAGDAEAQAAAEERFRTDRAKEARTATSEGRGAELGMTERDRFRRDFKEGDGKDINARAKEMRANGEDPSKFLRQALANQMEAVAPMLKGFQDERQNAVLQGPSRAALNVSDVSTSQGASELTRLLRGDDSAKDVNLAELRKQSAKLDEVVKAIQAANPGVLL